LDNNKEIKVLICGYQHCGKSSFINSWGHCFRDWKQGKIPTSRLNAPGTKYLQIVKFGTDFEPKDPNYKMSQGVSFTDTAGILFNTPFSDLEIGAIDKLLSGVSPERKIDISKLVSLSAMETNERFKPDLCLIVLKGTALICEEEETLKESVKQKGLIMNKTVIVDKK